MTEKMRVRIISDGTPKGTHVLLPTGDEMPDVEDFTIHSCGPTGPPWAVVQITPVNVDVTAELYRLTVRLPNGKLYQLVEIE
jgi:hypothetical protein